MSDYGVRINRALNYAQEKLPACVELGLKGDRFIFSYQHHNRICFCILILFHFL